MSRPSTDNTVLKLNQMRKYVSSNVKTQVEFAKNGKACPIMWVAGSPGIGKSEFFQQICTENGWGLNVQYISTMLLEMISGIPLVSDSGDSNSVVNWSKPHIFNFENMEVAPSKPEGITILLLDDAHQCNKSIQSYMFQLLTYRAIHAHKLPDNVAIILAGNRADDKAGFQQILAPVVNRLRFVNVRAEVDDWIANYAMKNNVRFDIISFLKRNPDYLNSPPLESNPWASPRSWTYASIGLDELTDGNDNYDLSDEEILVTLTGSIGNDYATEFLKYKRLLLKWEADKILNGGPIPEIGQLGKMECYALMSAVVGELLKDAREANFKETKSLVKKFDITKNIFEEIAKRAKEVIPLGLKMLVIAELQYSTIKLTRRLVDNSAMAGGVDKLIS